MLNEHILSLFLLLLSCFDIKEDGSFKVPRSFVKEKDLSCLAELKRESCVIYKRTRSFFIGTFSASFMDSIKKRTLEYISSFCDLNQPPREYMHPIQRCIYESYMFTRNVSGVIADYTGFNTPPESQRLMSIVDRLIPLGQRVSFNSLWGRLLQLANTGDRDIKRVLIEAAFAQNKKVFLQLVQYGTGLQECDFKSMDVLTREAYTRGHPEIYRHLVKMGVRIDSYIHMHSFGNQTKFRTCLVPGSNGSDEEESDEDESDEEGSDEEDDAEVDKKEESCNPPLRKKKRVDHFEGPPCFLFKI